MSTPAFAIADPTVFDSLTCQELRGIVDTGPLYCGKPAAGIVWMPDTTLACLVCESCQHENVLHRNARLIVTAQPRGGR